MYRLVAIEEGGIACGAGCPYYEEGGVVKCYGGPKRSHCRAIMEPWSFDCNKFNPKRMWKLKATEAQFKAMVKSQGLHAIRQKKLLPYDHQPSLQIGESGRTKNKWKMENGKLKIMFCYQESVSKGTPRVQHGGCAD